jgi:hypothetical protein
MPKRRVRPSTKRGGYAVVIKKCSIAECGEWYLAEPRNRYCESHKKTQAAKLKEQWQKNKRSRQLGASSRFSIEEILEMRDMFHKMPAKEIAAHFECHISLIYRYMFLHHTTITAPPSKREAMIDFYEGLCDLSQITPPDGMRNVLWFSMLGHEETHGAQLHIYLTQMSEPLCSGAHVAFVVASDNERGREIYDRVVAWAKREGIFLGDATPYWGSPRCYIMDPAENRIELFQYPPSQA